MHQAGVGGQAMSQAGGSASMPTLVRGYGGAPHTSSHQHWCPQNADQMQTQDLR